MTSRSGIPAFGLPLCCLLLGILAGAAGLIALEVQGKTGSIHAFLGLAPQVHASGESPVRARILRLEARLGELREELSTRTENLEELRAETQGLRLDAARRDGLEEQVARLLVERNQLLGQIQELESQEKKLRRAVLEGTPPRIDAAPRGHLARIIEAEFEKGLVVLDRGSTHGVELGQVFRARGAPGTSRVIVDEVHEGLSLATALGAEPPRDLEVGQILVLEED